MDARINYQEESAEDTQKNRRSILIASGAAFAAGTFVLLCGKVAQPDTRLQNALTKAEACRRLVVPIINTRSGNAVDQRILLLIEDVQRPGPDFLDAYINHGLAKRAYEAQQLILVQEIERMYKLLTSADGSEHSLLIAAQEILRLQQMPTS